jgi:hypothetical protein
MGESTADWLIDKSLFLIPVVTELVIILYLEFSLMDNPIKNVICVHYPALFSERYMFGRRMLSRR